MGLKETVGEPRQRPEGGALALGDGEETKGFPRRQTFLQPQLACSSQQLPRILDHKQVQTRIGGLSAPNIFSHWVLLPPLEYTFGLTPLPGMPFTPSPSLASLQQLTLPTDSSFQNCLL